MREEGRNRGPLARGDLWEKPLFLLKTDDSPVRDLPSPLLPFLHSPLPLFIPL